MAGQESAGIVAKGSKKVANRKRGMKRIVSQSAGLSQALKEVNRMPTAIHARVRAAQAGEILSVICRMPSGWAVMGDSQLLRGYCLLLADPVVPDLNALSGAGRAQFLSDMATIGDALLEVTDAVRCNYEILGNQDPALHAHIFPRFITEPEEFRTVPPMFYPAEQRSAVPFDPDRDRELMRQIAGAIAKRL